ncbi:MAG: FkbM family methyltransferase [Planctomycetes bacterium]|nr:FkbM family methyltransferase [Planctomycetota bacterium]
MSRPLPPITDPEITPLYLHNLLGATARVVLEIGAHHGWNTAGFLKIFPHASIYAFEPEPRAIKKFKANVSSPRIKLFETAIGAEDGQAQFHASSGAPPYDTPDIAEDYPDGYDQSGSLRLPKAHKEIWPWVKFEKTITVPVRSLDSWAKEYKIGPVDFIWADMQGAEGDLIKGGAATLARTRYLYTEYSDEEIYEGEPTLQNLVDMLPNFTILKRYPDDVLMQNMAWVGR